MSTDERVADILAKIREEPDRPAADVAVRLCGDDQKLLADVLAALDSLTSEAAATVELDLDRTVEQTAAATPFSDVPPLPGRRPSGEAGGSRPRTKGGGRFRRPDRVGVFQIDAEMPIGRGGFGEVWEGSRAEGGFRQRVAIKILSRSTSDETVVKRFELERQVLASLDHPDIARLIDGGTLDDDRPWLAMEFVEGTTITAFCDRERLSIEERIRLAMRVAMAVQHAHENLVVHRDIKPDNVMVTPNGDPKLLDFGIAKIVNPDLGGLGSRVTQAGEGVLTPDYAAPEQFTGESIGTRADVYSLGVLLYELLTGRLPFADVDRGYVNIRDAKLETEPLRPSEAVSTASIDAEAAKRISTSRNSGIDRIRRRLDGDIDVIILKALRREPSRRYGSPREFVEDLQRHLEGLPVEARPESIAYVTTRFLARHRAGFAVSVACLLAIAFASLAAVAVLTAQASEQQLEITSARAEAETARAEAAEQVRAALADLEIEAAASGTESLIRSLQEANQLDTASSLGALMLDRLERVSRAVPDDATIQARKLALELQQARIQWQRRNPSLGDSNAAASIRSNIAEELEAARNEHPDSVDLLLVAAQLAMEEADATPRADRLPYLEKAIQLFTEAQEISGQDFGRQLAMLGTDRADLRFLADDLEGAIAEYEKSHAFHARRGEDADRDLAILEVRMADGHKRLGDVATARTLMERSLVRRERLADRAARIESNRARRDLAKIHLYLQELLEVDAPATARRHLQQHLELTQQVAWLDPIDRRGGVSDVMKAMSIASRLIRFDGGDTTAFAETVRRFRDSIIEPRLRTLPDADARRLAIRADRYLAEVAIAAVASGADPDEAGSAASDIRDRLDRSVEIGRALLELETRDSEVTAEVGLCLAYRASITGVDDPAAGRDLAEASRLLELSLEQGSGGPLQAKLSRQLDSLAAS
ncbi:MAG: protein kinase [Planctomycetia bacterium]|nr:protein kinase [Planctomycetia bacterium]